MKRTFKTTKRRVVKYLHSDGISWGDYYRSIYSKTLFFRAEEKNFKRWLSATPDGEPCCPVRPEITFYVVNDKREVLSIHKVKELGEDVRIVKRQRKGGAVENSQRKEHIEALMNSAMVDRPELTDKQLQEHYVYLNTKSDLELENMVLINC